jgi:hypothetical protein
MNMLRAAPGGSAVERRIDPPQEKQIDDSRFGCTDRLFVSAGLGNF